MVKQGEVYFADLSPVHGSEQGGLRPVLVVSNNIMNKHSTCVIVVAITAQISEPKLPTHVVIESDKHNFSKRSIILLEQVRTIDKERLRERITTLDIETMTKVSEAWSFNTFMDERGFQKLSTLQLPTFVKGSLFNQEEDYEYEFKEIRENDIARDIIKDKVIEYTVAFLNDDGGRVLFGISDDLIVKGVLLSRDEKDDIRQLVNNKISDSVQPSVSPNSYAIEFHQVYDENSEMLSDLYIVEILIRSPIDSTIVYFDNKDRIWSKVNGGKRPLKGPAIQDFILRKSLNKALNKNRE